MVACVGLVDDMCDLALLIDDEGDTIGHADYGFGRGQQPAAADSTVGLTHRLVRVGKQWKAELVFLAESSVRCLILCGHPEDFRAFGLDR